MKRDYIKPSLKVTKIMVTHMICGSIQGVYGTGNFSDNVDYNDDTTDEYLSRRGCDWDD